MPAFIDPRLRANPSGKSSWNITELVFQVFQHHILMRIEGLMDGY
jgi:hypothetical protein